MDRGVLCGSDATLEWLLPWWWERYSQYNALPVTFCDFGMSLEALSWCKERGEVVHVTFDPFVVASQTEMAQEITALWEGIYGGGLWHSRRVWFQKPFACLLSPYQKTLWIDLDCEILSSIEPIFLENRFAIVRDFLTSHLPTFHPDVAYNSGVMLFEKGSPLLSLWAEAAMTSNHLFWGDDPLLAHLIHKHSYEVRELDEKWNWRISQGFDLNARIFHWTGPAGKTFIRERGGIKPLLDQFYAGIVRPM